MRAGLALAALLLAGCTVGEDAPPRADPPPAYVAATPVFALPTTPLPPPIAVRLAAENAWAKPLEVVSLRADGPALHHEWYVGRPDGRARITYVGDAPYATDAEALHAHEPYGDHVRPGPTAPRVQADTGPIAPGAPPVALTFPLEGRYVLAGEGGGEVNVTVSPQAPPGMAGVRVRGASFEPSEVDVRPGEAVAFLNVGASPVRMTARETLVRLEAGGAETTLAPVDEGAYDVVVVARDLAGGRGVASARVVADFDRPASRATEGPFAGEFTCSVPDVCDAQREHGFDAALPVRVASVNVSLGSPLSASVVVSLVQDGREVASAMLSDDGGFSAADLSAGRIGLRVRVEDGVAVSYAATVTLHYRLPAPP